MLSVERHHIPPNEILDELSSYSQDLYNKCNFYIRTTFFKNLPRLSMTDLVHLVEKEEYYLKLHNTKTAKQTIRKLLADWSNFYKSLQAYKRDYTQFKRRPKPPGYKKRRTQIIFYDETIKKKPLKIGIIEPTNGCFRIKSDKEFKQVVVTPKTFGYIVDVSYETGDENIPIEVNDSYMNIDMGVNNLCAMTSDKTRPVLINGRIVKSINQWYNKNPSKSASKKRYNRIENYFHHVSKVIIGNCTENDIKTIIIGHNDGWKQKNKMRKKNKQNFLYIPFNNLIMKIEYKAIKAGIKVIRTEEAYTSKASYLDRDDIPVYEKDRVIVFSGTRIKRGLYKSKNGTILNADVNGSGNIGRKIIKNNDYFIRLDRSLAARPELVNPLKYFMPIGLGEIGVDTKPVNV